MTIISGYALYTNTCGPNKPQEEKTSQSIGKSVTGTVLTAGFITLYALSILGILGMGPAASWGLQVNYAICGTLAAIDFLSIVGLSLRACGFGKPKETEQEAQKA